MYRIGWFSTGRDEAARQLLTTVWEHIQRGELKAEIAFVFSNREPGESAESDLFFQLVDSYQIPLVCFSSRKFKAQRERPTVSGWRLEYDREVMKRLARFQPDLCVLAGYMLIVGEEMCQSYKMINLHPAAPGGPAGTWQEVIWKLIESRAEETGVMMHLVTPELDKGPPVTYCKFSIRGEPFDKHWKQIEGYSFQAACVELRRDELQDEAFQEVKAREGENNPLFRLIRRHGLAREFPLIVATLKAFSQGKVKVTSGKVLLASGEPTQGYDLTEEIDEIVKQKGLHPEASPELSRTAQPEGLL